MVIPTKAELCFAVKWILFSEAEAADSHPTNEYTYIMRLSHIHIERGAFYETETVFIFFIRHDFGMFCSIPSKRSERRGYQRSVGSIDGREFRQNSFREKQS